MKLSKYYAVLISFIIAVVIIACTGIGIAIGQNDMTSLYTLPEHSPIQGKALALESPLMPTVMPTIATTKELASTVTANEPATITTTEELASTVTAEEPATITTTEELASTVTTEEPATKATTEELTTTERPGTITTTELLATITTTEEPATITTTELLATITTTEELAVIATTEELAVIATAVKPATQDFVDPTISSSSTQPIASNFIAKKRKNKKTSITNLPKIVLNIHSCKLFRNKAVTIMAKNGKSIPNYPDIGDSGQSYGELQSICEEKGEYEFIELIKKEICMLLNNMNELKAAAEACALKRINNQEVLGEELIQVYTCSKLLIHLGNFHYDIPFQFLVDRLWKGILYILLVANRANVGAVNRCVKPESQGGFIFNNTYYESNGHGYSLETPISKLYDKYFKKHRDYRLKRSIKYADVIMQEIVESGIHEFNHYNSVDKKAFRISNKIDLKENYLSYQQSSMIKALTSASDIAEKKAKDLV